MVLRMSESEFQEEYYSLFVEEFNSLLEEVHGALRQAFNSRTGNKDPWEVFFRVTHTLKGNAQLMGFENLAELSREACEVYRGVKAEDLKNLEEIELFVFSSRLYSVYTLFSNLLTKKKSLSSINVQPIIETAQKLVQKKNGELKLSNAPQ